jgi:wyosine [tRNA(Phe)-imidazoG37] synthetase (radical SAM superfamily)
MLGGVREKIMQTRSTQQVASVYGPVKSWRYGKSLGIDPIGAISTCSFNCVYCQLGEIEDKTLDRALFIPTEKIVADLELFAPWDVDVVTLSGSGEPTLALNLGEILEKVKIITAKPTLVLTNGTMLLDAKTSSELALADRVSVKIDAIEADRLRRINRPVAGLNVADILMGIKQFRSQFQGELAIQTMVLSCWSEETEAEYIRLVREISPTEIQLNTPTRPKPLKHELNARGNHVKADFVEYPVQVLQCVSLEVLEDLGKKIEKDTGIPVRHARL